MKYIWLRALLLPAIAALAGLVVWPFAGATWALLVVLAGWLYAWLRHLRNLQALASWLHDPSVAPVPSGFGLWEEIFVALHRHERVMHQLQHRLASVLARFRGAAQAMPDGVVVLNAFDHIVWCNATAERWFGLDAKKDVGQPIINLVRNPEFAEYIGRAQHDQPIVMRMMRGDELVLSLRVVPYGQDEKLLLSRDITQAEKLETMRRDFVANVSHELKTPLTVVNGFLETIADGLVRLDEPRGRQALQMMHSQTERMLHLVEDLLALSALEASAGPADETEIDIAALLHAMQQEAQALSHGRHVITVRPGPSATLYGDEREVASAVSNLLSNAVRYTPDGGSVTLSWTVQDDGEGWIGVEDTGIGLENRHLLRLTERFYRVDASRSRDTGGTGLGLAIVKHVLTRHQGRLEIASEPGRGSTFSAVFPARRVRLRASVEPAVQS